jgi:TonB family protein
MLSLVPILVTSAAARGQEAGEQQRPLVIRKSGGSLQGSAVKRIEPVYPPQAKAAKVSGPVLVELTVDEQGGVIAAKALSGHPLLKDSAVSAAKERKFKPTTLSGVPVKVVGTITFNFILSLGPKHIEALAKEVEKNPTSADARYELASAYYSAGRYQEAVVELKEAIQIRPEFAQAHCKLGLSYGVLKSYNEAANSFKEALRLDPDYADALVGLGLVDSALYLYDDAIANFRRAIELQPQVADTFFALAMTYSAMGRHDDAISSIKEGLAIRPADAQAHYRLGHIYAQLGNKQAAMDEYAILKKLDAHLAEMLLKEIAK